MLLADDREGERVPMGVDTIFCVYFSVWYCEGGNWEPGNMGGSQKNAARQELGSWKSTRMHSHPIAVLGFVSEGCIDGLTGSAAAGLVVIDRFARENRTPWLQSTC